MSIQLLLFGVLKDLAGVQSDRVELLPGSTVADLLTTLKTRLAAPHTLWSSLAVAVNREYASADTFLHEGDEVALLPPVSGGNR